MSRYPERVKLVEVSPRDGLQNEAGFVPTAIKLEFIDRLADAGLRVIEATSFVSVESVPQLADAEQVLRGLRRRASVAYPVLVPNERGLERALAANADHIAVFTSVSETFCRRNIGCGAAESLQRYAKVVADARTAGARVRGYISCALGCPYEGPVEPLRVGDLAVALIELGCEEVSLGDTIGIGTPLQARAMVETVAGKVPVEQLALHFHDTRGQALANLFACLDLGVCVIDSSVAGLGGCPYAPGAGGNVATEDVVYMLQGMGIETGVDLQRLIEAGRFITAVLGRENRSRVGRAGAGYGAGTGKC
jgi:hydroxymethylglutaryl-CoA lyase